MVDRWGWRWIYRKTGGVAEMKDNDVKGGRRVVWSPQERQAEFMQRGEYEALYGGAAGGGKSDALLAEALRQADKACYRGIIFRKTYPQLTELEDRSQTLYKGAYPAARYNKTKHCWSFPSGAKIYFGAMQHKKDRLNYQGKHYDFVGFDELTQFSFDEYSYMFSRNRPGGKGTRVYIRATANPGGPGHSWVKQRFITAGEPMKPIIEEHKVKKPDGAEIIIRKSRVFIPASVFDNKELLRNDPEYLASLSMLPTAERKALLYGDWNSFTGQVFTEWRDDPEHYCDRRWTHVIAPFEIPRHWEIVRGFDFGYTRPFSVGWYAVDTKGCIYRIREYYGCTDKANEGIRLEPSAIAENIRKIERDDPNIRGRNVYGVADPSIFDKSRGESVADLMARSPYFIIWSPGDNARISGKMQYHNRLAFNSDGEAMFYCFNTCREFIRTIPALMYDEKNVEDIDTTMEDHIYDRKNDLFGTFGDRFKHFAKIQKLMGSQMHSLCPHLPGDCYQRGAVAGSISHTGNQIGSARAQCRHTNTGLMGQTTINVGHKGCPLLMSGGDKTNIRMGKGLHNLKVFLSRNAKNVLHAFFFQAFYQHLRCVIFWCLIFFPHLKLLL